MVLMDCMRPNDSDPVAEFRPNIDKQPPPTETAPIDEVAERHAPYSSQSFMLTQALGLDAGVCINPSGGAFSADTPMVAGLVRIGEAAQQVRAGAQRALAHATAGPLLQHNLVCIMEAS